MAKSIQSLLSKTSWTGQEVGKALLMNLKHDIEQKGNLNQKPLFSQEEFNRMVDSLDDDYQYTEYKVLESIYSSILDSFNYNEAMRQQFYNGYYRYFLAIREAQRAEGFFTTIEQFPLILTQGQYNRLAKETEVYNRGLSESYHSLFFNTVDAFIDAVKNNKRNLLPDEAKAAIIATKNQKVTNKRILANWAKDMEAGYYILPDGRRSDAMTSEEWQEALTDFFIEIHHLYKNDKLKDKHESISYFNQERLLIACKLLFKGEDAIRAVYKEKTGQDIPEEYIGKLEIKLEHIIDKQVQLSHVDPKLGQLIATLFYNNGKQSLQWHYYTNPPTNLTKYDVLISMLDRYKGTYSNKTSDKGNKSKQDISKQEQFKEFKKDYPDLAEAVKIYLEKAVPSTKGLKANQLYEDLITHGQLADIGYLSYKNLIKVTDLDIIRQIIKTQGNTTESFNKLARGLFHGIAVIKKARHSDTEKDGNYIDPITNKFNPELLQGIDYLANHPEEAEYIQANLDILALPALRYMYAYNAFIEIVSTAYDIKFMTIAKYDLTRQENQIEICNKMLYKLYKGVYGNKEDKKCKRDFLRAYFQPIEIDDLKPTKESIDALKKTITELGYSREAAITLKYYRKLIAKIIRE